MMDNLCLLFIGSGAVNFGGAEGPWDHSRRLEQVEGVEIVAIADPDLPKAQEVLKRKQSGPHGDLYRDCKVYANYKDALAAAKPDIAFIGTGYKNINTYLKFHHPKHLFTFYYSRCSSILPWQLGSTTRH